MLKTWLFQIIFIPLQCGKGKIPIVKKYLQSNKLLQCKNSLHIRIYSDISIHTYKSTAQPVKMIG